MKYELLERINSPLDLKSLDDSLIPALSEEIRAFLIETVSKNGGHLASNLGIVELTLAIHKVFDSPTDRIVFDVGHQAYVHKLITGRREMFDTLRVPGGLSGFTLRRESEHDPFGAGHSSTSVSAALGFAEAAALKGEKKHIVCVLGDGAYTGGMVHEALNNCKPDLPLVIILNENGMSISKNKGTFASYISRVRASRNYLRIKAGTSSILAKTPIIGKPLRKLITVFKNSVKRLIYSSNYFEELGLYYLGPIDGNNYDRVKATLEIAKSLNRTVVIHLKTVKGKGYCEAENSPEGYHSIASKKHSTSFNSVFAEKLICEAREDERVVAVTAAMGIGTGLDKFGEEFPKRYFDVGIAEPHALTFSAALAADGLLPTVALYSTFLQRGYDSILHDIALQGLPVRIMIDRAGLAFGDGATHHGIFDVSLLSAIPGMTVFAPSSYASLAEAMSYSQGCASPVAIRYSNTAEQSELISGFKRSGGGLSPLVDFDPADPPGYVFITYGTLLSKVAEAKRILKQRGVAVGIILLECIKPIDSVTELVISLSGRVRRIVFAEEGILSGGAAQALLSALSDKEFDFSQTDYKISAIDDNFASPTEICDLYDFVGLSPEKLARRITEI